MADRSEPASNEVGMEVTGSGSKNLAPGLVVLDLRVERVGVVQEAGCETVWLRPRSGGREWEARAEDLRLAGT